MGINANVNNLLYQGYCFLYRTILFKKELGRIRHYYEIIKPGDFRDVGIGTMKIFLKSIAVSGVVLTMSLIMMDSSIYSYGIAFTIIFLLKHQVIINSVEREEYKLLKQFEGYLGEVRHHYTFQGVIEEALDYSLEGATYNITLHMNIIYEMLKSGDDCDFISYKDIAPHKLFVTFLGLCQTTIVYGDTIKNGKSLFLINLASIKREVNTEILKRDKIRHTFSGLLFVAILPIFFLKSISIWGMKNIPSLTSYYQGGYGIAVTILIFFLTYTSYRIIIILRTTTRIKNSQYILLERLTQVKWIQKMLSYWYNNNPIKGDKINELLRKVGNGLTLPQYLLLVRMIQIVSFLCIQIIIGNIIIQSRWTAINYGSGFYETSFIEKKDKIERYQQLIQDTSNEYKSFPLNNRLWEKVLYKEDNTQELTGNIQEAIMSSNPDIHTVTIDVLTEESVKRIIEYQDYYYRWYLLLISWLISMGLGYVPIIILRCKDLLRDSTMEDEVLSFYSIINMLMYIPRMHVSTLLEWLEMFSEVFQESIMECVDNYTHDEEIAFKKLIEKEPFLPFVRLVQNLQACDKVGIERAFDELTGQREFYIEKRKQDNEINISNKGVIGKVIAYIPLMTTISLYLIIPFVLESIRMFMNYVTQINAY